MSFSYATRWGARASAGAVVLNVSICFAMCSASSLTHPSRAEPLVCCSGDHHLVGLPGAGIELDQVAAVGVAHRADVPVDLDRRLEVARVVGQVGHHVVAAGVAVRVAGKRATARCNGRA
jgi:hypothetical protein